MDPMIGEETLFDEALRLPPQQRSAYLDRTTRGDVKLRQRVESLLNAYEGGNFLEYPAGSALRQTIVASVGISEKSGDRIGSYKLLQQIGEGGCGMVYMAEQEEPVRRRVALKIIKLGMDTKSVIARFEAERQALAMMDHPNIAKVLDAGASESGRPYFVMELVRGLKITDYCDQANLSIRARLELFAQVCHAIQHAHQKGIIHRDIKPSNILVTLNDGVAVPKVIDFGIAKATGGLRLTEKTVFTAFEQFIGTPAYMSPEQAILTSLDIDTRSDIYALGVLLYELLTGQTPFDRNELLEAGLDKMRLTIREKEPDLPSTRLSTMPGNELSTMAQRRGLAAPKLLNELRGDLDWIVMKCLEKDRARRYETANGLAMEIHRHLTNEPVLARPPSAVYRIQKFVYRNTVTVSAAALVAAVLVLGVLISTREAIRAGHAEKEQFRLSQAAQTAQAKETHERQKAEAQAYASDMNLAQQAISVDNLGRALELLNRHRPSANSPMDLRGWEWRYLWKQARSDALYTLCTQTNAIFSLAVSHDGKWLAVGEGKDEEGGLSIWDLGSRQQVVRLPTGERGVRLAFSPKEPLLAFTFLLGSGQEDRGYGVRMWAGGTRQIVAELNLGGHGRNRGSPNACTGLAFSEDGKTLLTAMANPENNIAIWRVPDGKKLATYEAPQRGNIGTPFAVTHDLKVAAYETYDVHETREVKTKMVRVVDLAEGKELWTAKPADEVALAFALSPNGKILATGSGYDIGTIGLWDVPSGKELARLEGHRGSVGSLVFWPDGKTLASGGFDQTIRLWDVSNPVRVPPPRTLRGHQEEVWRLALLPDGKTMLSGSKDGTVLVWNPAISERERAHLTLPAQILAWSFSPDSKSVLAMDRQGQVAQWQGEDFQEKQTLLEAGTNVLRACISVDCRLIAASFADGTVEVWDSLRGVRLGQCRLGPVKASAGSVLPWQFLAGGRQLAILDERDNSLQEWDLATWRQTKSWRIPPNTQAIVYSSDERWSLALGYGGASSLIDRAAERQFDPKLNIQQASWGAFSPDGGLLAVASHRAYVRLWNIPALRETATLGGFLGGCPSVVFSSDGKRLATCRGGSDAMKIWDVTSRQELLTLAAKGSSFRFASFSEDGNLLGAMDYYKGVLNLWRAPSWEAIEAAERPQGK